MRAVLLCLVLGTSSLVSAQSTGQAETLFKQARALMGEKKYAEACTTFEASYRSEASATTLFSLGVCRELEGKLATAYSVFVDFQRKHGDSSDATITELVRNATDRATKLEPRLSTLSVSVHADARGDGLVIERDGTAVDPGAWDRTLPIDGGSHTVTARRPGYKDWSQTITVGNEGDKQTITVPALELVPVEAAPATPIVTAPPSRVPAYILGGTALLLGGGAIGLELWGRSQQDKAESDWNDNDPANDDGAQDLHNAANLKRYLAQGIGVAAIACAGVSIYFFVRGGGSTEPSSSTALRLVPSVSGDRAGLSLTGGW